MCHAQILFKGGVYTGYSRTKQKVENFKYDREDKNWPDFKTDNEQLQNQGCGLLSVGAFFRPFQNFEFGINGLVGTNLMKEEYFKNRFCGGLEFEGMYQFKQFSIGLLGGVELNRFRCMKYEYTLEKPLTVVYNLINDNASSTNFLRGFIGAKMAYTINNRLQVGIKYHCIFSKNKNIEEDGFVFEKGVKSIKPFALKGFLRGTEWGISKAECPKFNNNIKFLTHRILVGLEFRTKGE